MRVYHMTLEITLFRHARRGHFRLNQILIQGCGPCDFTSELPPFLALPVDEFGALRGADQLLAMPGALIADGVPHIGGIPG